MFSNPTQFGILLYCKHRNKLRGDAAKAAPVLWQSTETHAQPCREKAADYGESHHRGFAPLWDFNTYRAYKTLPIQNYRACNIKPSTRCIQTYGRLLHIPLIQHTVHAIQNAARTTYLVQNTAHEKIPRIQSEHTAHTAHTSARTQKIMYMPCRPPSRVRPPLPAL